MARERKKAKLGLNWLTHFASFYSVLITLDAQKQTASSKRILPWFFTFLCVFVFAIDEKSIKIDRRTHTSQKSYHYGRVLNFSASKGNVFFLRDRLRCGCTQFLAYRMLISRVSPGDNCRLTN